MGVLLLQDNHGLLLGFPRIMGSDDHALVASIENCDGHCLAFLFVYLGIRLAWGSDSIKPDPMFLGNDLVTTDPSLARHYRTLVRLDQRIGSPLVAPVSGAMGLAMAYRLATIEA